VLDVVVALKRGEFSLRAEVHDSGFICLSGLNGSGKSTLLNIIAGTIRPDSGYVKINSKDVTRLPIESREVVLVNPDSNIPHLDVEKHLVWGAAARKLAPDFEQVHRVRETLGINYGGRIEKLSLGMRERVALATALLARPKVILVDEAFSNIDHREDFIGSFATLCRAASIDLMHTSQHKDDARLADHHYEIVAGTSTRIF
jgi:molybdate/tungstate transport system ATP-binding protein